MTKAVNDYDAVPYESFPYPNTNPEHLYAVGKLFGMSPELPKKCRVLELGCASGGNIIPMAINYPDAEFIGIDLSKVQIDEGNKHVENLKIKNLKLQNVSIMDIDESFGKFDYIIAHGILSWVPRDVQDKIFEISKNNLSENGIAYISYNTLPGWSAIRGIREMMLYHTDAFEDPAVKTLEARRLLEFIAEGNGEDENPYKKLIENEIKRLKDTGDSYLAHDHLEANNEPFYFNDVMKKADSRELQYLGDASVSTMFVGNLPEKTAETLKVIGSDVVRTEQYMDFVKNRRFRSTLLCNKGVELNRNLNADSILDFYLTSELVCEKKIEDIDFSANEEVAFGRSGGATLFITSNADIIRALFILQEESKQILAKDLISKVLGYLGKSVNKDGITKAVNDLLLRLVLLGVVKLHVFPASYTTEKSDKPKVSDLSRYQATYASWVTTQRSEKVDVDIFNRVLFAYLDGNNDFDILVEKMVGHIESGDLNLNTQDGEKISDKAQIKQAAEAMVRDGLAKIAPAGLLVA